MGTGKTVSSVLSTIFQVSTFMELLAISHASTVTEPSISPSTSISPISHPRQTFSVYGPNGVNCVLMEAEIMFTLKYPTKNGFNMSSSTANFGLQRVHAVFGDCGYLTNFVNMTFNEDWILEITISSQDDLYWWSHVYLEFSHVPRYWFPYIDPGVWGIRQIINVSLPYGTLSASRGQSYKCDVEQKIDLGDKNTLQVLSLQYDAFSVQQHRKFDDQYTHVCTDDSSDDSGPYIAIAVCVSLLGVSCLVGFYILWTYHRKRSGVQMRLLRD